MGRRGRKVNIPQKQLQAQREDLGKRVSFLMDRYHAMHVMPLHMALDWHLTPLWKRIWLKLTGQKPDIDEAIDERMAELDAMIQGPCTSHKGGLPCELGEGHEGEHKRRSFGDVVVTWTDEEADDVEEEDDEA